MPLVYLTQSTTPIFGQIAKVLGWIMEGIYRFLDMLHIPNIGIAIIIFTIIINLILLPLNIKQQKFSKMNAVMTPEINKIRKKYGNKKDQESMLKMNEEIKAVYSKYGVSQVGSCVQLLIQMPILYALFAVIRNIPAYVSSVKVIFSGLASAILTNDQAVTFIQEIAKSNKQISAKLDFTQVNSIIDVLSKFTSDNWHNLVDKFPQFSTGAGTLVTSDVAGQVAHINTFLGLNISETPFALVKQGLETGAILLVIGAALIPILSGLTQWLNTKLMPQQSGGAEMESMESTMKTMNLMMPIMSLVFAVSMPTGLGIYWIANALVRSLQQFLINRHLNKMDLEELLKKNLEKANKKREKKGIPPQRAIAMSKMNVKNIEEPKRKVDNKDEKEKALKESTQYYNQNAKPGSLASKANMVKQYNDKHKK